MTDHIHINLTNLAVISLVAVLAVGGTLLVTNFFADRSVPLVSHLSRGGSMYLSGGAGAYGQAA